MNNDDYTYMKSRQAMKKKIEMLAAALNKDGDLEYLSWFGYSPNGLCPRCGAEWSDFCYGFDGPHCS